MSTATTPDTITFLPLGAILQSLPIAGHNIVQAFPTQSDYEAHNSPHFGATIGRVANRLAGASVGPLNGGKTYTLAANDGPNNLHGGPKGWGKRVWDGPAPVGVRREVVPGWELGELSEGGESVRFSLVSEDGDEGFPGTVEASVVYTAGKRVEGGKEVTVLGMEYEAKLTGGAEETVINMTNHSCVSKAPRLLLLLLRTQADSRYKTTATSTSPHPPPSPAPRSASPPTPTSPSTPTASPPRHPRPTPSSKAGPTSPSSSAPPSPTSTTASC